MTKKEKEKLSPLGKHSTRSNGSIYADSLANTHYPWVIYALLGIKWVILGAGDTQCATTRPQNDELAQSAARAIPPSDTPPRSLSLSLSPSRLSRRCTCPISYFSGSSFRSSFPRALFPPPPRALLYLPRARDSGARWASSPGKCRFVLVSSTIFEGVPSPIPEYLCIFPWILHLVFWPHGNSGVGFASFFGAPKFRISGNGELFAMLDKSMV